jgi:hypothetical protein
MTNAPAHEPQTKGRNRSAPLALVATLLTAVAAVGMGIAVAGHNDSARLRMSSQLTSVENACRDWLDSSAAVGADDAWCEDMVAWMRDHGRGGMMQSWMWGVPDDVRDACRQWVDDDPDTDSDTQRQRCDAMTNWMRGHMTSTGGSWMMRDR